MSKYQQKLDQTLFHHILDILRKYRIIQYVQHQQLTRYYFAHSRGTPSGNIIKVAEHYDVYLATPPAGRVHEGVGVLLIPDVFGIWQNNQLIADQFAANGYTTIIPDIFNGDPLDIDIDPVVPGGYDVMGWLGKGRNGAGPHTPNEVDPIVVAAINYLKDTVGVKRLASVGYCLGAKVRLGILSQRCICGGFLCPLCQRGIIGTQC